MQLPDGTILTHMIGGLREAYSPVKAHEYYLRTRKLKGRKKGSGTPLGGPAGAAIGTVNPKARARQKQVLKIRINNLEHKLMQLNQLIQKKEGEAKDAAKEAAKPATAAEKSDKARSSKKYADKHKQEIQTKAKAAAKAAPKKPDASGARVTELKTLATKVKGQIAVAKTRLAAL